MSCIEIILNFIVYLNLMFIDKILISLKCGGLGCYSLSVISARNVYTYTTAYILVYNLCINIHRELKLLSLRLILFRPEIYTKRTAKSRQGVV